MNTFAGKVALLTCFDIEFPELSRLAMEQGVNMIFCPSCTTSEHGLHRVNRCARARAIENQVFVITAGLTGGLHRFPDLVENHAYSGIYSPCDAFFSVDGVIAEGVYNRDMILYGNLDLKALKQSRETVTPLSSPLINCRRQDLYTVQINKQDLIQNRRKMSWT